MACFAQSLVDPEFEAELKREGVPSALVQWLVVRCPNGPRFANYVDKKEEMQELIVDQVQETRSDRGVRAALVEVWKRHEAAQDRRLGRMAAGIQEADWEDPLEGAVRDRLYQTFAAYYHFVLKPWNSLCDPLLGRFKREIDRNHFTVCPVTRAKSQASYAKVFATQKVRVSDVLAMDIGLQRKVSE